MFDPLWSTVSMVIYAIWRPDYDAVYIGKTTCILRNRLAGHLHSARTGRGGCRYIARAIRLYGPENMHVHVIDGAETEEELNRKEVFWIKELRANDRQYGYNLTDGGEGTGGRVVTEETRQKQSTGIKTALAKRTSAEKAKWRANVIVAHNYPDVKARMSAAAKTGKAAMTEEARVKMHANNRAALNRPDVKVRMSMGSKAGKAAMTDMEKAEWRANVIAASNRPDVRARVSAGSRAGIARMTDAEKAEWRANLRVAHNRPDVKTRMSTGSKICWARMTAEAKAKRHMNSRAGQAARWAREEAIGRMLRSPEVREQHRLKMQAYRARQKAKKEGVPA